MTLELDKVFHANNNSDNADGNHSQFLRVRASYNKIHPDCKKEQTQNRTERKS